MKRCPTCGETKALTEFYRNKGKRDGHQNLCKSCQTSGQMAKRRANRPVFRGRRLYTDDELRWRPIEHVIEDLECRQLGAALGINKDGANTIKRDVSACVDTALELTDERVMMIRGWLEAAR